MRKKQALKIMVDMAMLVLLFLLMSRHITGNLLHEWLGMGIWFTIGLTWLITALFALWRYKSGKWKTKSLVSK